MDTYTATSFALYEAFIKGGTPTVTNEIIVAANTNKKVNKPKRNCGRRPDKWKGDPIIERKSH